MPIFQDEHGLAVKFFLQKDLAQETQAELCEMITSLGGRVESKVPRQGFVLVQHGTAEEERLKSCWTSPDRPDRHFVPYTYVEACKIAGMLLKQIFVQDNVPLKMHIHPSIANPNARAALSHRIVHSGGDPTAPAQSARVILADPNTDVFQHLVKAYQGNPDTYIESYLWVKKCVEKGALAFTPLVYKNPGGRRPGEERTQFTDDDEANLAKWIAAKIPFKETGGRTGNRLYQQLCEMSGDSDYAWVTRHTWQSWRERYKKNATRFDTLIAALVDEKKPAQGEKGQYGYVRQAEAKPKRTRTRKRAITESNDEPNNGPSPLPVIYTVPIDAPGSLEAQSYHHQFIQHNTPSEPSQPIPGSSSEPNQHLHAPGDGPLDAAFRSNPVEEEAGEPEEDPDFVIRVGHESPPKWGKRKASDSFDVADTSKRHKSNEILSTHSDDHITPVTQFTSTLDESLPARMHVIDQGLRDIAQEFRFTAEEVQEFYDKCGEMGRTRARFEKLRKELNRLAELDDD